MSVIRAAEAKDVDEVVNFIYLAIKDIAYQLTGESEYEPMIQQLKQFYLKDDNRFSAKLIQVYDIDGYAVGMILCYHGQEASTLYLPIMQHLKEVKLMDCPVIDDEADEDEYYVDAIAVSPSYQGRGIAKALLAAAEKHAATNSYNNIALNVDIHNTGACRLYEQLGYVSNKKIKINDHPYWHMVKPLNKTN